LDEFESGACIQTSEAALYKSIRTWSFDRNRFAEANPIRVASFSIQKGKGQI